MCIQYPGRSGFNHREGELLGQVMTWVPDELDFSLPGAAQMYEQLRSPARAQVVAGVAVKR